jgi:hypothetical protein
MELLEVENPLESEIDISKTTGPFHHTKSFANDSAISIPILKNAPKDWINEYLIPMPKPLEHDSFILPA